MPYKNKADRNRWQRENNERQKSYRNKWMEGEKGLAYIKRQKEAQVMQKKMRDDLKNVVKAKTSLHLEMHEELYGLVGRSWDKVYRKKQRLKALSVMGSVCVCCGMDDPDVLEFDHIRPVGKERRSESYQEVLRLENPYEVFQLLCANCHRKKTRMNKEFIGAKKQAVEKIKDEIKTASGKSYKDVERIINSGPQKDMFGSSVFLRQNNGGGGDIEECS